MGTVIRKLGRFMRFALLALVVIGLLIASWFVMFGESTLRTQIEQLLVRTFDRPVRVGSLSVNLAKREVELRDVVIPGRPDSTRPTLKVPRMRLGLSFRSLFTSKIQLRRFELEKPEISVQVFPDGTTDLPRLPETKAGGTSVSIGAVVVHAGDLFLNHQRIPLTIAWPNFEATLETGLLSALKGTMSAGPGPMQVGDLAPLESRFEVGLRFENSILHVENGVFEARDSRLALAGELDLHKEPKGEIRFTGPADLDAIDRSVIGAGLDLHGIAQTKATLTVDGEQLTLAGTLRGAQGSYDSIPIETFSTAFIWDGANTRLTDLELKTLGGTAALAIDVPSGKEVKVKGTLQSMNAEPLLHWLFESTGTGLGSRVSGPIDLAFPRAASNLLSGSGDLVLTPEPSIGEPLSGRVPFKADKGVVTLSGAQFIVPRTTVNLSGVIQPDRRLGLELKLASEDLAASDLLGTRLRKAFGSPDAQPLGFVGKGILEGRVTGTISDPVVTGRFAGSEIAYLGVNWGVVEWTGSASALELKSERLIATRGPSRIELSGSQRLGAAGVDDAMDLNVRVGNWKAADLLHVVNSDLDVETDVSGTLRLQGSRSKPLGSGTLTSVSGRAMGLQYAKGDLKLKFEGDALRVENLTATFGGGEVAIQGLVTDERGVSAFAGAVDFKNVELADLGLQTADAPAVGGRVTGRATLQGPVDRPIVQAHLESNRIFYGDEGLGAVTLEVKGEGDGTVTIDARADSPRFLATVTGSVETKAPYASRLTVRIANARIDPVLRALGSRFENAVVITASANAEVEGPLQKPEAVTARIRDGKLRIAVPDYAIEAAPGSIIDVENREVRIAGLNLTGEGTSLAISGKLALRPTDENDLSVSGRADLRVFSGFVREWRLRGSTTLRSQIRGTPKAIRASGGIDIEGGALRVRGFPQGLDDLNGRIVFNETQARVAGLEGRFGGGRVSVSGQMSFGGAVPSSFDFSLNGDSLGLRYPEGLRATFGAALRLQGTADAHWLTGDLLVSKAIWTRKYAITSELFSSQASGVNFPGATGFKPSPMHLDIAIRAPGTLRLDNNIADIAARADLTLSGSPAEPQLLGRVEIERGKVYFSGNTYEVRKGVAHFSNPREVNPVFDLEADTRLRDYRLTLQANGTLDRVTTRITSDPPLTTAQIASLLTGGDPRNVNNVLNSEIEDPSKLGTGGVNTFASTWLDENITGKVAQGFGLSRLSIDPGPGFLGRAGSRLTVGKRVSSDLEVVYTRSIFGSEQNQTVSAEYSLSNRFSLVASWDEQTGLAADVRTRFVLKK